MGDIIVSEPRPHITGPIINGSKSGGSTDFIAKGSLSDLQSFRALVKSRGANPTRLEPDEGGQWILSYTFPYETEDESGQGGIVYDQPVDQHDLDVAMETVPAFNSPVLYALLGASASKIVAATQLTVKKYHNGEFKPGASTTSLDVAEDWITAEVDKIDNTKTATALKLLRAVAGRGVESVIQFNTVYRRTITAAVYWQVQAAYTGNGKIWTDTEVTNFEGTPTNEWFGLEANTQWLKTPPNVSAVWGGKTQITYSYIGFKQASRLFYEAYGSATLLDV